MLTVLLRRSVSTTQQRRALSMISDEFHGVEATIRQHVAELYALEANKRPQVSICASGGGAQLTSWLLGTPGASGSILEVAFPYHREAVLEYFDDDQVQVDSFCSMETALRMARRARARGLSFLAKDAGSVHNVVQGKQVVGIGVSAALATTRERRGNDQCFVVVSCSDGHEMVHSLKFYKGLSSRYQQDFMASMLAVKAILWHYLNYDIFEQYHEATHKFIEENKREIASPGFVVGETRAALERFFDESQQAEGSMVFWPKYDPNKQQVVYGEQKLVGGICTKSLNRSARFAILSGSFNPLHEGHEQLALAASDKLAQTHKVEVVPMFELAVKNVDKGAIDLAQVETRVKQFADPGRAKARPWPVAITNASRFIEKAKLFPNSTFVIGFDTAIRLIDKKYYNDDEKSMITALEELQTYGCDFVVAGRLTKEGQFHEFSHMVDQVPPHLRAMFIPLTEKEFRVDLSSTEIRQRMQQQKL